MVASTVSLYTPAPELTKNVDIVLITSVSYTGPQVSLNLIYWCHSYNTHTSQYASPPIPKTLAIHTMTIINIMLPSSSTTSARFDFRNAGRRGFNILTHTNCAAICSCVHLLLTRHMFLMCQLIPIPTAQWMVVDAGGTCLPLVDMITTTHHTTLILNRTCILIQTKNK